MEGGNASESGNYNAVVGHTYTISSSKLNELRVGVNKYNLAQVGSDFGIAKNNELGIPNGNIDGHPYTSGIADFNIPGYRRTGSPGFTNSVRIGNTVQLSDTLSWLVGPALAEVRRRLPAHHVHADESADAAPGPLQVRHAVHEQQRRGRHGRRLCQLPARAIRIRSTATSWTPIPRC